MGRKKAKEVRNMALDELDKVIESGDVNAMLDMLNTLMANGVTPEPRQVAKISAHIYKVNNANLATEFGTQYGAFGAFNEQLAEIVLAQGTAEDNYDFALYVPNSDKLRHGMAIKKRRNKMWWLAFSKMWPAEAHQIMAKMAKEAVSKYTDQDKSQDLAQSR